MDKYRAKVEDEKQHQKNMHSEEKSAVGNTHTIAQDIQEDDSCFEDADDENFLNKAPISRPPVKTKNYMNMTINRMNSVKKDTYPRYASPEKPKEPVIQQT